jgi:hypothetical protein
MNIDVFISARYYNYYKRGIERFLMKQRGRKLTAVYFDLGDYPKLHYSKIDS